MIDELPEPIVGEPPDEVQMEERECECGVIFSFDPANGERFQCHKCEAYWDDVDERIDKRKGKW